MPDPILPDRTGAIWGLLFAVLVPVVILLLFLYFVAYVVTTRRLALKAIRRAEAAEVAHAQVNREEDQPLAATTN
ncbi:MAG TPA: hypothetical protein VM142_12805 [Acidimicrobiales bacterium]|nr:hypothetical protein [Acidimicrobiales bacterium]